ncbi:hypothetical protein Pmar_PMAR009582 [Perkinsus marinus ATCC 50983]|uniref:Uncharacterized protein n=1 Tax=Perkinsus marinus (strain ATCC 50983 / TXsc) TaxID=423536 RepID=C5KEK9_PERM5|nr:hypothetical protein Pmar_PMAR009582 [Perkinsus marinus ATCC 50983]EER17147.1 hypothetical protein Pmar_PMAR009582 [Perkinsus marinus ATCC 50983]|eukprot:XP_002785351.1 hypothetical protein Pmar_PMAR009582 [Perkinsus marinus ATCC 50983]
MMVGILNRLHSSSKMTGMEFLGVLIFIIGFYNVVLIGGVGYFTRAWPRDGEEVFWGYEDGLWDHPEPNYKVLPWVAEFYAVVSAIPLAGITLLYQAIRYRYDRVVLVLCLMDVWMYTCAFFSHMTLYPPLNAITLTSVLTNSLYTFFMYSWMAGGPLKSTPIRAILTVTIWLFIVQCVRTLPAMFGHRGGVPALLVIQVPAVVAAASGAAWMRHNCEEREKAIYGPLLFSGALLILAMGVSVIEVVYGQYCQDHYFGNFPLFHVIIHTLEQIGIYLYGVMVASIRHTINEPRKGAKLEYCGGWLPYLRLASSSCYEGIARSAPSVVPNDTPPRGGSGRYNLRKRVSKTPTGPSAMEDSMSAE